MLRRLKIAGGSLAAALAPSLAYAEEAATIYQVLHYFTAVSSEQKTISLS